MAVQQPPQDQGRTYDRYASASLHGLDCEGEEPVAVMIDEGDAGVERVELRREDVWVLRRDRDRAARWLRPEGQRIESAVPEWVEAVLRELGLGEVLQ